MTITPYPFQKADLEVLKENGWVGLLNVEMGGGKTVTAVQAIEDSGSELTLVIAPQSTHKSWASTVDVMLGLKAVTIGNANKTQREAKADFEMGFPGVYMVTPQLFTREDVSLWTGDMLIVDEIHLLGRPGSKGQKKLSRSEEHTSELQSRGHLVCRLLLEKKKIYRHLIFYH